MFTVTRFSRREATEAALATAPAQPALHPSLQALWQFWDRLRGARAMPRADEIDAFVLRPWLGHIVLLDVVDDGCEFRYRVYGSLVAEQFGFDLTGRLVGDCEPMIGPQPLAEYRRVASVGRPEAVARMSPAKRDFLKMDKLALPLARADGGPVTRILCALYASEPDRP